MFVNNANSVEYSILDPLGAKKRQNRWHADALIYRLRKSGRADYCAEADRIARCAEVFDVIEADRYRVIRRRPCGSPLCPVCGERPTGDRLRHLRDGIERYRAVGVSLYFVTLSPPDLVTPSPKDAITLARNMFSAFAKELRSSFKIDWSMTIELVMNEERCGSHVHCVVAVLSDVPEKSVGIPRDYQNARLNRRWQTSGSTRDKQSLLGDVQQAGLSVFLGMFAKHSHLYCTTRDPGAFVNVQPVDDEPNSPLKLAAYCTKALRCGLTADGLLDVPEHMYELLITATKAPNKSRSCRLSQSARGSVFSRLPKRKRRSEPDQQRPIQRQDFGACREKLFSELEEFLNRRMHTAVAKTWAEARGWPLVTALHNDDDWRAFPLLGCLMSLSKRALPAVPRYCPPASSFSPPCGAIVGAVPAVGDCGADSRSCPCGPSGASNDAPSLPAWLTGAGISSAMASGACSLR